jgi:predicted amidohydrolase
MSSVRVACAQIAPVVGEGEGNLARARAALEGAAAAGAGIVVLPELATSGYVFRDAAEARTLAAPEPPAEWRELAERHDLVVVGGFCEAGADGALYNSAAIVDASGVLTTYRKAHLWDREQLVFTPGDGRPPVVDTRHGRIGLMVCYDLEFPEWVRVAALSGTDLLCVPTNWPRLPRPEGERPLEIVHAMSAAAANGLFVAACDRCGTERGVDWVQGSVIVSPQGWLAAGPPQESGEALVTADLDLHRARDKSFGERNDVIADRRPELYGDVTAS